MKVAAAQLAPVFKDVSQNTLTVIETIETLKAQSVDLIVFPEAFLTGYCFESAEEAHETAIEADSEPISKIASASAGTAAIVGFAEHDGDTVYNSAVVISDGKVLGVYRKTHMPFLGLDRYATAGNSLPIFDIAGAKVGVLICYDVRVPEASRCYALEGADIICVATNWPETAEKSSDIVCPTRAMENHVYVIAADRVGEERGYKFIGRSKIIDPLGNILASADHDQEAIVTAVIDPASARDKNIVKVAGEYELPLFDSRNPDLYSEITKK